MTPASEDLSGQHQDLGPIPVEWREPCQVHGRLVLDLALGRLDDDRAGVAERVRRECLACRSLWQGSLAGEHAVEVGSAVAAAFSSFRAPARRRIHQQRWLAAAAVFCGLIAGLLLLPRPNGEFVKEPRTVSDTIFIDDFEAGGEGRSVFVDDDSTAEIETVTGTLFLGGFESGDLSAWSPKGLMGSSTPNHG